MSKSTWWKRKEVCFEVSECCVSELLTKIKELEDKNQMLETANKSLSERLLDAIKREKEKKIEIISLTILKDGYKKKIDDRDNEIRDLNEKIIGLENVIKSCNSRIRNAFEHASELEKENLYCRRQVRHVETAIKDLITKLEAEKR